MKTWLTPKQVSKAVGRHYITVIRALECGELHGHQTKRCGHWQVNEDVIDAWIQGRTGQEQICGCAALRLQRKSA